MSNKSSIRTLQSYLLQISQLQCILCIHCPYGTYIYRPYENNTLYLYISYMPIHNSWVNNILFYKISVLIWYQEIIRSMAENNPPPLSADSLSSPTDTTTKSSSHTISDISSHIPTPINNLHTFHHFISIKLTS